MARHCLLTAIVMSAAFVLATGLAAAPASAEGRSGFSIGVRIGGHHGGHHGRHHSLRHHGRHGIHIGGHHGGHHGRHGIHIGSHHGFKRLHHSRLHHKPTIVFRYHYGYPYHYTYKHPYAYRYSYPSHYSYSSSVYNYYGYRPNTATTYRPNPTTYGTTVTSPTYSSQAVYTTTAPATDRLVYADGWTQLQGEQPQPAAALNLFAAEAERYPNRGLPKVGYAISQALLGNDEKTGWALRRAVHHEPDALGQVPVDDHLRTRLHQVIQRLDQRVREGFSRSDDLFTMAALHYIMGEHAAAHSVIHAAVKQGDRDPTTRTLQEVIDRVYQPDGSSGDDY